MAGTAVLWVGIERAALTFRDESLLARRAIFSPVLLFLLHAWLSVRGRFNEENFFLYAGLFLLVLLPFRLLGFRRDAWKLAVAVWGGHLLWGMLCYLPLMRPAWIP